MYKKNLIENTDLNVSVKKKRYNTRPIDEESNVLCYEAEGGEKYLKEFLDEYELPPKGMVDLYHCGTGRGKTSYIIDSIAKEAKQSEENVLMIVHRKSIIEQMIRNLSKNENLSLCVTNGVYSFDNITLVTYQKLYNEFNIMKQKNKFYNTDKLLFDRKYKIICCDEIHMIQDDALFSQAANEILDNVLDFFRNTVSYSFFSATMETVENIIYEKVCSKLSAICIDTELSSSRKLVATSLPPIRKFKMENAYKNYCVLYIEKYDEIKEIYNSLVGNQKMIVFVSSKAIGEALNKVLDDSVFVFAEQNDEQLSSYARVEYQKIIENERFDCKCLITTKVLDAGVNLKMSDLNDIVIATEDGESEFKQIVGRKRREDGNSQIRLYVLARNKKYFVEKRYACDEKLKYLRAIHCCAICKRKWCDSCTNGITKNLFSSNHLHMLQGLIKMKEGKVIVNEMAEKRLKIIADYCDDIIEAFDTIGKSAFIIKQLSWLGLETQYNDKNYFKEENAPIQKSDLIAFLESNLNCDLNKELQMDFKNKIQELFVALNLCKKRSENVISINKINKILKENKIPFKIESRAEKPETVWEVIKHIWDNDKSEEITNETK